MKNNEHCVSWIFTVFGTECAECGEYFVFERGWRFIDFNREKYRCLCRTCCPTKEDALKTAKQINYSSDFQDSPEYSFETMDGSYSDELSRINIHLFEKYEQINKKEAQMPIEEQMPCIDCEDRGLDIDEIVEKALKGEHLERCESMFMAIRLAHTVRMAAQLMAMVKQLNSLMETAEVVTDQNKINQEKLLELIEKVIGFKMK